MFRRFAEGINFDDLDAAMEALEEVVPGGHFLGTAHTLENFMTAFASPELMDSDNYEQWLANGGLDAEKRGRLKAIDMLAQYEQPALAEDVQAALDDFVQRRESEIPETLQ